MKNESAYNQNNQVLFNEKFAQIKEDEAENEIIANGLHPIVKDVAFKIVAEARAKGLRVELFEGFRSFERQDYLLKVKHTTKARGGQSWHNYGLAVDIVFKDARGKWTWGNESNWKLLGEIGKANGMIWGGDWGWDMAHFEWHPMFKTIKEAFTLYKAGGEKSVWEAVKTYTEKEFAK